MLMLKVIYRKTDKYWCWIVFYRNNRQTMLNCNLQESRQILVINWCFCGCVCHMLVRTHEQVVRLQAFVKMDVKWSGFLFVLFFTCVSSGMSLSNSWSFFARSIRTKHCLHLGSCNYIVFPVLVMSSGLQPKSLVVSRVAAGHSCIFNVLSPFSPQSPSPPPSRPTLSLRT